MSVRFVLAAVASATFAVLGSISAQAGDKCLDTVSESGHKKASQREAHASAIRHWQYEAADQYGRPFGDWRYSGERAISCTWAENGSWYKCTASARPCARVR